MKLSTKRGSVSILINSRFGISSAKVKSYQDLFVNEIKYEVDTAPLKKIKHHLSDWKDMKLRYYHPSSLVAYCWMFKTVYYPIRDTINHLDSCKEAGISLEDLTKMLYLVTVHKFAPLIKNQLGLNLDLTSNHKNMSLPFRMMLVTGLAEADIFIDEIIQEVIQDLEKAIESDSIPSLITTENELQFMLLFIGGFICPLLNSQQIDKLMKPSFLNSIYEKAISLKIEDKCRLSLSTTYLLEQPITSLFHDLLISIQKNM